MKLEAYMAKFITNYSKIKQDGKFHYDDIVYLEDTEIYSDIVIGLENPSKTFVGKSHFRGKESVYEFYVMMFKIVDLQYDESPKDFKICYTPKKGTEERQLQYDEHHHVFFDEPIYSWDSKDKKYKISNDLNKAVLGAINAGVFYLNVYKDDAREPLNSNYYKILILPSSLPFSSYQRMVDDILQIRKELIMEKTAGKQSVQLAWEHSLVDINRVLDEITYPLLQINNQPKVKLTKTYEKVPTRTIKKFNSKILMNQLLNQGSTRNLSVITSESAEIYENEIIYYALSKLKQYMENYRIKKAEQLQFESKEAENAKAKILNEFGMDDLAHLNNLITKIDRHDMKKEFFQSAIKTLNFNSEVEEDTMEVIINVHYNFRSNPRLSFGKNKLIIVSGDNGINHNKVFSLDFERESSYSIIGGKQNISLRSGRKCVLELHSANLNQHVFLLEYLRSAQLPTTISIHAVVKKNPYNSRDPLQGKPVKKYDNLYDYSPKIIELKAINNQPVISYVQPENYLKEFFSRNGSILAKEERLKEITSIQQKIAYRREMLNQFEASKMQVDKVLSKIDNQLRLSLFQKFRPRKLHWKLTQIFISDKHYSRVWKLLRALDKTYEFTEDFEQMDVVVKKASDLYEYWIFITLIKELTQSGWKIIGSTSLLQAVNQFLRTSPSRQHASLEGIEIKLEHPGKIENIEGNLVHIEKLNITVKFNHIIKFKRPDYAIRIDVFHRYHKYGELKCDTKWFYLDAKYRNYNEQGGKKPWYTDMNEVAIEKYSNYFYSESHPTSGAFIIHPDVKDEYTYYGGFMTQEMTKNILPLREHTDRNPRHQFGSVAHRPGHIQSLKLLIRMLLEYHFVSINTPFICFECGSTNTSVEIKSTEAGKKKYHITCKDCEDFWVRNHCSDNGHYLVKHQPTNFHREETDSPWFVKCPVCDI